MIMFLIGFVAGIVATLMFGKWISERVNNNENDR